MSDIREAFEALEQAKNKFEMCGATFEFDIIKAALGANGEEKFKLLPSVRDYLYEGISDSVNSEDECPDYEFAYQLGQIVEHYSPAPPSVAVPEGWKLVPTKMTGSMLRAWLSAPVDSKGSDLENMQKSFQAMLTAAPSGDDIAKKLKDPSVVHAAMLRGEIAKLSIEQVKHLHPELDSGDAQREVEIKAQGAERVLHAISDAFLEDDSPCGSRLNDGLRRAIAIAHGEIEEIRQSDSGDDKE